LKTLESWREDLAKNIALNISLHELNLADYFYITSNKLIVESAFEGGDKTTVPCRAYLFELFKSRRLGLSP